MQALPMDKTSIKYKSTPIQLKIADIRTTPLISYLSTGHAVYMGQVGIRKHVENVWNDMQALTDIGKLPSKHSQHDL